MVKDKSVEDFKQHIIDEGILDPEGVHHEFVSGLHGRKLDFDAILADSNLFRSWVLVVAQSLRELYPEELKKGELVLLSVANGTNRLVGPVAKELGNVTALLTKKISPKVVEVDNKAKKFIKANPSKLVVTIEDVGTKGSTSATAIKSARAAGAKRVESLNTWQRRPQLEELEAIGAVYHSIIHDDLETPTPEECQVSGYCAKGWEFVKHD